MPEGITPAAMPARRTPAPPAPPAVPQPRTVPGQQDPQTALTYWNHQCPSAGCSTIVPNHRHACAQHQVASRG